MTTANVNRTPLGHSTHLLASLLMLLSTSVWASTSDHRNSQLGNDEASFVFAGKCATQETYRLFSYQKNVAGLNLSFYDYEGPNGKGTVQSDASPKVMAARVCRRMAEIISANYWE